MAKKLRKKIIAGNWKMNKALRDAESLATDIARQLGEQRDVDVVLCPPFTALKVVGDVIESSVIKLGAQNMHWESGGAYTGEISGSMLRDLYCHYVILGHSERREHFRETDTVVNRKIKAALAAHLTPILCVGESLTEREAGREADVVTEQMTAGLADLEDIPSEMIIAYEPVWAIGTGKTATPAQAQEMHALIRSLLASRFGEAKAQRIRLQYGGSVKPDNAAELFSQPDIDGGLVGGASLEARAFVEIVQAANPRQETAQTDSPGAE
ncbi:MAG: triose-phosphate isomerase [Verrucomicrobia bacterium]|nr:triose-phosphate isomerase [Verrucomicrobiota bacterium]